MPVNAASIGRARSGHGVTELGAPGHVTEVALPADTSAIVGVARRRALQAGGVVGDGEGVAGVGVRQHGQADGAGLVGERGKARIEVELERGGVDRERQALATVTVTAVLFAARVTAGDAAVSIVAGTAVWVVIVVV